MVSSFEDLDVYQKAFSISVVIHKETLNFPKIEQYSLANQIRRASKSVCANLAEGYAKQYFSNAEYKQFVVIAMGSANEMMVWIDYCAALGYIDNETRILWRQEYVSIAKMLNSLCKSIRDR